MDFFNSLPLEVRYVLGIVVGLVLLSPIIAGAFDSAMHIFWWLTYGYRRKRSRLSWLRNRAFTTPFKLKSFKASKPRRHAPRGENFYPWRADYYRAFALWLVGLAWIAGSVYLFAVTQNHLAEALGMISIGPLFYGCGWLDSGLSRKRGKAIEEEEKRVLKSMLPERWEALPDVVMDSGGDIDLSLRFRTGEVLVIEIKSWNYWSRYVRKRRAVEQVQRQKQHMKTRYGIVWLPKAREKSKSVESDVLIVCGRIKFLFNCIEELMSDAPRR